ncbi:hypothetical protein [Desulfuromonas sp. CSMB_57]|jgi:hypothetical protein|uniref:hypothetical protein n=1 Tax=Desulfuromonas sp. CSMB_57 TaxID=2807629 RepID=UPI001CD1E9EB|nr:hypothetical protein [Desulfuromonas sp. CSMB_57]
MKSHSGSTRIASATARHGTECSALEQCHGGLLSLLRAGSLWWRRRRLDGRQRRRLERLHRQCDHLRRRLLAAGGDKTAGRPEAERRRMP